MLLVPHAAPAGQVDARLDGHDHPRFEPVGLLGPGREARQLVDQQPRLGAHGRRVAFLHPASTGGVLIELVEEAADRDRAPASALR